MKLKNKQIFTMLLATALTFSSMPFVSAAVDQKGAEDYLSRYEGLDMYKMMEESNSSGFNDITSKYSSGKQNLNSNYESKLSDTLSKMETNLGSYDTQKSTLGGEVSSGTSGLLSQYNDKKKNLGTDLSKDIKAEEKNYSSDTSGYLSKFKGDSTTNKSKAATEYKASNSKAKSSIAGGLSLSTSSDPIISAYAKKFSGVSADPKSSYDLQMDAYAIMNDNPLGARLKNSSLEKTAPALIKDISDGTYAKAMEALYEKQNPKQTESKKNKEALSQSLKDKPECSESAYNAMTRIPGINFSELSQACANPSAFKVDKKLEKNARKEQVEKVKEAQTKSPTANFDKSKEILNNK